MKICLNTHSECVTVNIIFIITLDLNCPVSIRFYFIFYKSGSPVLCNTSGINGTICLNIPANFDISKM